jgi:hypothetical protein
MNASVGVICLMQIPLMRPAVIGWRRLRIASENWRAMDGSLVEVMVVMAVMWL